MSCRASPPDASRRHSSFTSSRSKPPCTAADGLLLPSVKTESDEDMKDYAETAMNELLGWYGYDKVSAVEARKLGNSVRACSSSSSSSPQRTDGGGGCSPKSRTDDIVSDDLSDKDAGNSRDTGGTGTPVLDVETLGPSSSNATIICAWCLKNGLKLFTLKTAENETKAFCSELCFDQCRRATFKKNRICDWCKHVRHTVSYVDFQDKDHQLQFCSDKCLNQYKMNIFCKETQAYLQMHPHLLEATDSGTPGGRNLITPDLWLKDCKESTKDRHTSSESRKSPNTLTASSTRLGDSAESNEFRLPSSSKNNFRETFKPEIAAGLILDHGGSVTKNSLPKQIEKITLERTSNSPSKKPDFLRFTEDYHRRRNSLLDNVLRHDRTSSRHKLGIVDCSSSRATKSAVGRPSKHSQGFAEPRTFNELSPPPPAPFPPPLINGSLSSKRMHPRSRSSSPMPSAAAGSPGLTPPPPLLSSDMLNSPFIHPQFYQHHHHQQQPFGLFGQQQQLEAALLASQTRFGLPSHPMQNRLPYPPETSVRASPLNLSATNPLTNTLIPPATVMLPYPLVVPLPVPIPIPIPIPLPEYLKAKMECPKGKSTTSVPPKSNSIVSTEEQAKRVDSIVTKLMTKHQVERQNPVATSVSTDSSSDSKSSETNQADSADCHDDSLKESSNVKDDNDGDDDDNNILKSKNKRSSILLRERTKRTRNM